MPLKPIFEKSPLTALKAMPLRAGMARVRLEKAEQLYALSAEGADHPELWEGAFRLACAMKNKPAQEPVYGWILAALDKQAEDGALPMAAADALTVMGAAWAVYEHDASRALLEKLLKWCAWVHANWDTVIAERNIRTASGDLMALLENVYRVTGKKPVLALCEKLRHQAMDWSGVLHTFAVQRPMARVTAWKNIEAGMEAEGGDEAAFYTRQYLTCHGEGLADGARASVMTGLYSGNGRELTAGKAGWEKISRYHGAVCGGVTSDETVCGKSPAAAVDAAALGAWAEAMAVCGMAEESAWAYDAAETLIENGMPAALVDGKLVPFQRANGLAVNCGTKDCYHVHEDARQPWRALARLMRGYAALMGSAVMLTLDGANVNLYLNGRYALPMQGGACVLNVAGADGKYTLTLSMKQPTQAKLALRVPAWTRDACISINDEGGDEGHAGSYLTLEREWHDGDVIHVDFAQSLTVESDYHQSAVIRLGAKVMAYVPGEEWAVALCGEPEMQDGKVVAPVKVVPDWHKRGNVPADLPVLPETEGETILAELVPYAEAPCRMAVLPRGRQA